MLLQQQFTVSAPLVDTWAFFQDVPAVAGCVPGVERIDETGPGSFSGDVRLRVGPLSFRLSGRLVQQDVDEATHSATLVVTAEDRALASAISAKLRLRLAEDSGQATAVTLETDANVLGKLGQFGQGVIKLTADGIMKQFVACARERLAQQESVATAVHANSKGEE